MKIQQSSVALLFLLLGLFCGPVVDAQESYRLIFIIPDEKTPIVGTVIAMDLYGVQTTFSDQRIDIFRHSISPDHQKIAAKDTDNNLIILDTDGEVIFRSYFEALNNDWQRPWGVHGWQDENTLVIVGSEEDDYKFYQLDLTASPAALNEMVVLNSYLKSIYADPRYMIISPNYRYVTTPFLLENGEHFKAIIRDLRAETEMSVSDVSPWWINGAFPTWSHSEREMAFVRPEENSDTAIYLYRDHMPLKYLTGVNCASCLLFDFQWSPIDDQLAYWRIDDAEDKAFLILVQIATGTQEQLASTTGSIGKPYWSPDGNYLVYLTNIPDGSRSNLVMGIVDMTKRTHFTKEIPNYLQIVGWLLQ